MLGSTFSCYCGNLNHSVSSNDLADLFSCFGAVERAQVITEVIDEMDAALVANKKVPRTLCGCPDTRFGAT